MLGHYLFVYVVDRDFGFAPNPFHRYCTLATCKPIIRKVARINDWVMGVGGTRLKAKGKCIYLMKVTEILTFTQYWQDRRFEVKKALRNGSKIRMLGDNIYHKEKSIWVQEDSHHSNTDGTPNEKNIETDTRSVNVLISNHYFYFGSNAINVQLDKIGYKNGRQHKKIEINKHVEKLLKKIAYDNAEKLNRVSANPFQFNEAQKRVNQRNGKILN